METTYKVYRDQNGRFRWNKIRSGYIIADSGYSCSRRSSAVRAARRDARTPADSKIIIDTTTP